MSHDPADQGKGNTAGSPSGGDASPGYDLTPLSEAEKAALAGDLTPEERRVMLYQGTESPFCGGLLGNKEAGVYTCRLCGLPLFRSSAKFESGTGWPSFHTPFDPAHIRHLRDISHGMIRDEIRCQRCDGHLGHVFDDGPPPSGQRYCLNSASLAFYPEGMPLPRRARADQPGGEA